MRRNQIKILEKATWFIIVFFLNDGPEQLSFHLRKINKANKTKRLSILLS
jgi:hypothetical protein